MKGLHIFVFAGTEGAIGQRPHSEATSELRIEVGRAINFFGLHHNHGSYVPYRR
jgi:hypothetical protein